MIATGHATWDDRVSRPCCDWSYHVRLTVMFELTRSPGRPCDCGLQWAL